jgi:hypothetical protein
VRRAIQSSEASIRTLAKQYSVNPKTVAGAAAESVAAVTNAANGAVCDAVTSFEGIAADAPEITSSTTVTDVRTYFDKVAESNKTLTTAVGALSALNLDLGGLTGAVDGLTETIDGLTGDPVGGAADTINASLTQLSDAYTGIKTAANCQ